MGLLTEKLAAATAPRPRQCKACDALAGIPGSPDLDDDDKAALSEAIDGNYPASTLATILNGTPFPMSDHTIRTHRNRCRG